MNEGQGIVPPLGQLLIDHFGPDGPSPLHLNLASLFATLQGHIQPLVGKGPVHANQHLFLDQIP